MMAETLELIKLRESLGPFSSVGFLETDVCLGSMGCLQLKITTHTSSRYEYLHACYFHQFFLDVSFFKKKSQIYMNFYWFI